MTQRTDIHRPSEIIPSDYEHVMEFGREWVSYDVDEGKDEEWSNMDEACELYEKHGAFVHESTKGIDYTVLKCDVCGARYKYGSMFRHKPSGKVISMGHDCASNMNLDWDRAWADRIARQAAGVRLAIIKRRRRYADLRSFVQGLQLTDNLDFLVALRTDHKIVKDIRGRVLARPERGVSDAQAKLVRKLYAESLVPKEEELQVAVPIVEGKRQTVEGTIVSCKYHDSDYGGSFKITVKVTTDDGVWLTWGSLPSSIEEVLFAEQSAAEEAYRETMVELQKGGLDYGDASEKAGEWPSSEFAPRLRGRGIRFDARLKAGREDHFSLFSRPTKAVLEDLNA